MLPYDKYLVQFSGGKDSIACFLNLLDMGIPKDRIELWHQKIDGEDKTFMDWEITNAYCKAFADAFGVPIYFQWKEGGFKRELLRDNTATAPTRYETPINLGTSALSCGGQGKGNTRLKFPQVSPDLSVRWCSSYLKIDVCAAAIRNQERFNGIKTVVISGERGEESAARAKYKILEPDRADARNGKANRFVERWRPVRDWTEKQVWDIIERYKIRVHPAYYLGWGRVSCKLCIFGSANQFTSANKISPAQVNEIALLEKSFGKTIKRNQSVPELIAKGVPYEMDELNTILATSHTYNLNIIMKDGEWFLPQGAFGESCGSM